jgi:hypothetical protein
MSKTALAIALVSHERLVMDMFEAAETAASNKVQDAVIVEYDDAREDLWQSVQEYHDAGHSPEALASVERAAGVVEGVRRVAEALGVRIPSDEEDDCPED